MNVFAPLETGTKNWSTIASIVFFKCLHIFFIHISFAPSKRSLSPEKNAFLVHSPLFFCCLIVFLFLVQTYRIDPLAFSCRCNVLYYYYSSKPIGCVLMKTKHIRIATQKYVFLFFFLVSFHSCFNHSNRHAGFNFQRSKNQMWFHAKKKKKTQYHWNRAESD